MNHNLPFYIWMAVFAKERDMQTVTVVTVAVYTDEVGFAWLWACWRLMIWNEIRDNRKRRLIIINGILSPSKEVMQYLSSTKWK